LVFDKASNLMIVQSKAEKIVGKMTACRSILLTPNIFFKNNFLSPPNEPELSCGGEQPPHGSLLRGRSDHRR
jgi:hypothetical protein